MDREELSNKIHREMLSKSFSRQDDGLTSILIGHATSIATDILLDDLESRVCENCEYCDSQFRYEPCPIADEMIQDIGVNFGCNEFKRKLNDNK